MTDNVGNRSVDVDKVYLDWNEAQRLIAQSQGFTSTPTQLFTAFSRGRLKVHVFVTETQNWTPLDWQAFQLTRQSNGAVDPPYVTKGEIFRNNVFDVRAGGLTYVDIEEDADIRRHLNGVRLSALDDEAYLCESRIRVCLQDVQELWPAVVSTVAQQSDLERPGTKPPIAKQSADDKSEELHRSPADETSNYADTGGNDRRLTVKQKAILDWYAAHPEVAIADMSEQRVADAASTWAGPQLRKLSLTPVIDKKTVKSLRKRRLLP